MRLLLLGLILLAVASTGCRHVNLAGCKDCCPHGLVGHHGKHGMKGHGHHAHGHHSHAHHGQIAHGHMDPCAYGGHGHHGHPGGHHGMGPYGTPGYKKPAHDREYVGPQGPPTAQVGYPYYTVRGPRDFLIDNPPSIGR